MKKIERLTQEQEARLVEFRDEFLRRGLSCDPADREAAEAAVADAYRAGGLEPPATIIWLPSPMAGAVGAAMLANKEVGAQVGAPVWAQVGDQVGDQVRAQVRAQVWAQVGDQVGDQVRDQVWAAGYGQHDAGWLSSYEFFAEACGVADAARLAPMSRLSAAAGWWWPFERLCIITDRPSALSRDAENRLHSETGPAIQYRDGWGVYAWHGRRVPADWIENRKTLDPSIIVKHKDVEMRAVGAAIIGWPRMLSVLKAKTIDAHANPDIGELIELTLPGLPEPGRFLKAVCPRNGIIVEGVPRVSDIDGLPIETALAAQAWRIGDPASEYAHPPVRT